MDLNIELLVINDSHSNISTFFAAEFPWMTAIIKEEPSLQDILNVYQCGGSLIHPSVRQIQNEDEILSLIEWSIK